MLGWKRRRRWEELHSCWLEQRRQRSEQHMWEGLRSWWRHRSQEQARKSPGLACTQGQHRLGEQRSKRTERHMWEEPRKCKQEQRRLQVQHMLEW